MGLDICRDAPRLCQGGAQLWPRFRRVPAEQAVRENHFYLGSRVDSTLSDTCCTVHLETYMRRLVRSIVEVSLDVALGGGEALREQLNSDHEASYLSEKSLARGFAPWSFLRRG